MPSSLSTGQSQRCDSESSGSDAAQNITPGSARVVPGAKASGQELEGQETIPSSSTTTTFPSGPSSNASHSRTNSPQPNQRGSSPPSASQRGSRTDLKLEYVDNWTLAVQGANVPEEVKAIVRTGMHAWSRGISHKANTTATTTTTAPAARG